MTGTERYIYLLKRKPTAPCQYDQTDGLVVIASTVTRARRLAFNETLIEGPSVAVVWMNSRFTSCQRIGTTYRKEQVVLVDHRAG